MKKAYQVQAPAGMVFRNNLSVIKKEYLVRASASMAFSKEIKD